MFRFIISLQTPPKDRVNKPSIPSPKCQPPDPIYVQASPRVPVGSKLELFLYSDGVSNGLTLLQRVVYVAVWVVRTESEIRYDELYLMRIERVQICMYRLRQNRVR